MELQDFCKEFDRMCRSYQLCEECGFRKMIAVHYEYACKVFCMEQPKKAEMFVGRWSKEHPIITNADKFK